MFNRFNSYNRKKPTSQKVVNNKNKINNFYQEILEHSAKYIKVNVNEFDNINNTLTIKNMRTDYGTEGVSPNNFEVIVFGLNIPGNFKVEDVNGDVVVTLFDEYIDFDNTDISDIYVIGKLVEITMTDELGNVLSTENDLDIII
jgi:hypothetical protein